MRTAVKVATGIFAAIGVLSTILGVAAAALTISDKNKYLISNEGESKCPIPSCDCNPDE